MTTTDSTLDPALSLVDCTDPTCTSSSHDLADEDDFEHEGPRIERTLQYGAGWSIGLARRVTKKPGDGAPDGWFVEVYTRDLLCTPDLLSQFLTDLTEARHLCVQANAELVRRDRLARFPLNEAITLEIEAMMGDRGLNVPEAAAMFGMTLSKLSSRLNGHTAWTAGDLQSVAETFVGDEWYSLVLRWFAIGSGLDPAEALAQID